MEPKVKKKVVASGTIIVSSLTALLTWAGNEVKKIPVIEERVNSMSKTQDKIEKKIDAIYEHLIKR